MRTFLRAVAIVLAPAIGATLGFLVAQRQQDAGAEGDRAEVVRDSLTEEVTLRSEDATLVVRFPPGWQAGRTFVDCDRTRDLHVSTSAVALGSIQLQQGARRACLGQLDPRPLPTGGAYVSLAFLPLVAGSCSADLPGAPPSSLDAITPEPPDRSTLAEFGVEEAYEGVERRRSSWCASERTVGRIEVLLREDASEQTREELEAVVASVTFEEG